MDNINKILKIRFKKADEKVIDYLTERELEMVLNSIDTSVKKGRRNLMIMSLMYDTVARSDEIIKLKIEDINMLEKYAILTGKGNKQRIVPLSDNTIELIKKYLLENNIKVGKLLPENGYSLLRYIFKKVNDIILNKNITPHVFRHTRAVHLLSHGVPLIYIRDLLGHSSITTTEIYAKVMEENKFEAIKKATPNNSNIKIEDWNDDQDLLSQLLCL